MTQNQFGQTSPDRKNGHRSSARYIHGTGPMADLVRTRDWSSTPLGPIQTWSESLLCSVNLMLSSRFPCNFFWGPQMTQIYNDAYIPLMGENHPAAMGKDARECWPKAWSSLGPQLEAVMAHGETTYRENVIVPVVRNGRLQDIYWTYSASPIYLPTGEIGGILVVCHDSTEQVLASQKLRASEARAHRILDSIGDAVIVTDTESRITRMNPIAATLTGWTLREVQGRPLSEVFRIINETTRQSVEIHTERVRQLGIPAAVANHTILIAKDSSETFIEESAAPLRSEDGTLTGIVLVFRDITQRRAIERERDALGSQLQQVLSTTTDGVMSLNHNWHITYVNTSAQEILAPSGEILGKNVWETFPNAIYPDSPYVKNYYAAMNQRIPAKFESYYPEPLNRWFSVLARPSEDGIILFFHDVTEQRREAAALRESQAQLSAIYDASASYIGLLSPQGTILDCNRAALQFAQNVPEEVKGIPFWDGPWFQFTPGAPDLIRSAVSEAAAGNDCRRELSLNRSSGDTITFDFSISPVRDAQGKVVFLVPEGHDISSLKSAELALAASKEELQWTVELSTSIPWTADPQGGLLDVSHRWLQLTGLTREQSLGEGWSQIIHPDDLERTVKEWSFCLLNGDPYELEHRIRTADGEYRWVCSRAHPRRNEAGQIIKWYGTLEDIDDRKRGENALIRSEKLAAVGRLAASIAHEINNPLEAVFNLLYLAGNSQNLEDIQGFIATCERELRRVSAITNQTLRFYKQATSPKAVFAEELIESVLAIYQGRIINAHIQVLRRFRAITAVRCFEGEIRQVLLNLIGNAIDAMQPNGGPLLIRSREGVNWKTDARGLIFTVADSGNGIDPLSIRRIFDAFFTTKGFGGTGLGLWVSKEIVGRHQGSLRVRSRQRTPGAGTVFTLFLPLEAVCRESLSA